MARIVGGIATSHSPTIEFAFDTNVRDAVDVADTERELRIMVEEERGDVVGVDEEQDVGTPVGEHIAKAFVVGRVRPQPRNAQVLYSVAGKAEGKTDWEAAQRRGA